MIESLYCSVNWLVENADALKIESNYCFYDWIIRSNDSFKPADLFRNESSDCFYEGVIESLIHTIHSNLLIYSETNQVTVLWASHWIIHSNDSFKPDDLFENESSDCFMSESLNHSFKRFIQTWWFIQKRIKWLFYERVIESFIQNDSFKPADLFRNESSDCFYERVIESFIQTIHSNLMIYSEMNQVTVLWASHWIIHSNDSFKPADLFGNESSDCFMSESLNHSFKTIHSNLLIYSETNQVTVLWASHWIIHSNDSFKPADLFGNKSSDCFMSESFTELIMQNTDSIKNESSDCFNERVIESFIQTIHSWFIQKRIKWLFLWVSHWIIHWTVLFKKLIN